MACCHWLVVLLLPAVVQAQSGDSDEDPIEHCFSEVSRFQTSLTCKLDHDLAQDVTQIVLCETSRNNTCLVSRLQEDIVIFHKLGEHLFRELTLEVHFKTGEKVLNRYDLRKIIKPSPPTVTAFFSNKSEKADIEITTTYSKDFLENNLLFHILIKNGTSQMNYTTIHSVLQIDRRYLTEDTEYRVKVKAMPSGNYFSGFWSDWSPVVTFHTPKWNNRRQHHSAYTATAILLIVLVLAVLGVLRWNKEIRTIIWPSIPNPKHTLGQAYKPAKHSAISFDPESFSDHNIHMIDQVEERQTGSQYFEGSESEEVSCPSSHQTCKSANLRNSTSAPAEPEELGGEDGPNGSTEIANLQLFGRFNNNTSAVCKSKRDDAYVTMSSFYNTQ